MNTKIELVPDENLFLSGITKYVKWDCIRLPHVVIFGSTGSGKTYFLKILLGRIAKYIPDSELCICDYKSDEDFSFAAGSPNLYRFSDCLDGLNRAIDLLQERQHGNSDRHFFALVFDEWASFITNMDKKSADLAKQKLATLLMLGRSFNIHVIVSQQRLDASYFNNARDNFSVICGLGSLSKESVEMMFSEFKDLINRSKTQGHGSIALGNEFKEIVVPRVSNIGRLQSVILSAINRYLV